jgi:hypothetical protein
MHGREDLTGAVGVEQEMTPPRRLLGWLEAAPPYPPNAADLRTANVLGLRLPIRATVAIVTVALLLLLDYHGRITGLVETVLGPFGGSPADAKRLQAIGRLLAEGVAPMLVVLLVFRDRPSRYGVALGD